MTFSWGRHLHLVVAVSAVAALDLGLFLWYLNAAIIEQPFADMYSLVQQHLTVRDEGGWWAYLWAPHNEHRLVFLRLLLAFDISVFSGISYPFIVVTGVAYTGTAWLLWRECRKGAPGSFGWVLGCVVLMVVLTSVVAVDIAIPIFNTYVQVVVLVVVAILLFDHSEVDGTGAGQMVRWRRCLALLAGCAAPLALATGWLIWPILFWLAWRSGAGRTWLLAIAGIGAILLIVYLRGLSLTLSGASEMTLIEQLVGRVDYLFTYMGLPWTRASALQVPGRLVGALLFSVSVGVVCWRGFSRGPSGRLERMAVAMIMFSLFTGVLAALARAGEPVVNGVLVPVRYSVMLTPLHVGLLWVVAPALSRLWVDRARARAVTVCLLSICGALVVQQIAAGQAAVANTQRIRSTIERFLDGQTDADMATVISEDLDAARRELAARRRAGVYVDVR
jgi:hypothetical protein